MISRTVTSNESNVIPHSIEPQPLSFPLLSDLQPNQNTMIDSDLGDIEIKELNFDEETLDISSLNISSTSKRASVSSTGAPAPNDWWNDLDLFQASHSYRLHKE